MKDFIESAMGGILVSIVLLGISAGFAYLGNALEAWLMVACVVLALIGFVVFIGALLSMGDRKR